jgi:signal transduction histidine kinase
MSHDQFVKDPAFTAMSWDMLQNVLARADKPSELGDYLTEEIRELTGARCVMFIQCLCSEFDHNHRVVSVNPSRRREWAEAAVMQQLYAEIHHCESARLWRNIGDAPSVELLLQEGFALSLIVPLTVGSARVGAMLVLGLPDDQHIESEIALLTTLASIVALVLRNAFLYEAQEMLISERTSRLEKTNRELQESRKKLLALNEELERRVALRTADLQAANAELESFSYSVSHDLRAPLRHLCSYAEILQNDYAGSLDTEAIGYLQRIDMASRKMAELVEGLLKLARLGRASLAREQLDLSAMARGIVAGLQESAPDRQASFLIADNQVVTGDPVLMRAVMENLLGNAWKFTARNVMTTIEFGSDERDGERVYFVRDNGVGFDNSQAENVFNVFQRLHQDFEGCGIGLASVQRIISRHGGRVWAESKVWGGATFYFTLGH